MALSYENLARDTRDELSERKLLNKKSLAKGDAIPFRSEIPEFRTNGERLVTP
jgi:hypothetical protein